MAAFGCLCFLRNIPPALSGCHTQSATPRDMRSASRARSQSRPSDGRVTSLCDATLLSPLLAPFHLRPEFERHILCLPCVHHQLHSIGAVSKRDRVSENPGALSKRPAYRIEREITHGRGMSLSSCRGPQPVVTSKRPCPLLRYLWPRISAGPRCGHASSLRKCRRRDPSGMRAEQS